MPKKAKAAKNTKNKLNVITKTRDLLYKTSDQEYGKVIKMLGSCRVLCECFDSKERLCRIRGSLKKVRINENDIVILSLRDFQDDKADIVHVYTSSEIKLLKNQGHIPKDKFDDESNFVFEVSEFHKDENEFDVNDF